MLALELIAGGVTREEPNTFLLDKLLVMSAFQPLFPPDIRAIPQIQVRHNLREFHEIPVLLEVQEELARGGRSALGEGLPVPERARVLVFKIDLLLKERVIELLLLAADELRVIVLDAVLV